MEERIVVPKGEGDNIETPPWLFDRLNRRFRFVWDAAATAENSKVGAVLNCLEVAWADVARGGVVFMNPPYSDPTPFVRAASDAAVRGVPTVALLKGDPSTRWWGGWVAGKAQLIWIPRRIRFYYKGLPTVDVSNFPSVLAIYHGMDWNAP
jgi:phage N-6-adenine-methyltransferase